MRNKFIAFIVLLALLFAASDIYAQNIVRIGRDIDIGEEQRADNAFVIDGQITVSGLVEKNLVTVGGSVVLTNTAVVRGNIFCIGGVVVQGNGAQIYGRVTEVNSSNIFAALSSAFYEENDEWSWLADIISFCFFLMLAALAMLMVFLFPRPLNKVADCIRENKFKSFFGGAAATVMTVPFFMLLIFSFIGIALIPLAFLFILLAFMFGFIAVSALLGKFILTKTFRHHKQSLIRETLLGLILWWIIGWLPFYFGMFIKAVVITVGFGGVLLTIFYRGYNRQEPPVAGT
ncbi:MAG: polymer-forming cytoskeletal protein [Deltaproteobacteria bacterium]|nr:polymer-forming cytoskeletal protein [Deltaproteobacteria bacterium]